MDCLFGPCRKLRRRWMRPARAHPPVLKTPPLPQRGRQETKPLAVLPTKSSMRPRPNDPIEAFFTMLVEAVDRDIARKRIQESLREVEDHLSRDIMAVNVTQSEIEFIEANIDDTPALTRVLAIRNERMEMLRENIEKNRIKLDDLTPTSKHSRQQLSHLFRQIYETSDTFLSILVGEGRLQIMIDGGMEWRVVPCGFASDLRFLADSSRRLQINRERIDQARKSFVKACKPPPGAASPQQRVRQRKRAQDKHGTMKRQEAEYTMLRTHQKQMERDFLEIHAETFLVENKKMHAMDSNVDQPSMSELGEISGRPREQWSGIQGTLRVPWDGRVPDKEELQEWRSRRNNVHRALCARDKYLDDYSTQLLEHLYAYPRSSQVEFDKICESEVHEKPSVTQVKLEEHLDDHRQWYNYYRKTAKAAGNEDLPLSLEWAASENDVAPPQSPTILYHMEDARVFARNQGVENYRRRVARLEPSWTRLSALPFPPSSISLHFKLGSDRKTAEETEKSTTLSFDERSRRIQRMSDIASMLRSHFIDDYSLLYTRDTA